MAEQVFRTAMRTTDVVVTALFSPAAVVAIGLADLYARFPLRIGLGLGGGAIALSSQDTGAGATATRDEVVRLGSTYLAIIFATAPARHVALVGARARHGTRNTTTPMYVNVFANSLNIAGSVLLGLGLLGFPRLEIVGVGVATAVANLLTAALLVAAIWGTRTEATFVRPRNPTIAKQLLALGAGDPDDARYNGWAVAALGVLTVGTVGLALVVVWGFGFTGWATRAADMMAERGSADYDPTDD